MTGDEISVFQCDRETKPKFQYRSQQSLKKKSNNIEIKVKMKFSRFLRRKELANTIFFK
jgi:predicted metal-binding protein